MKSANSTATVDRISSALRAEIIHLAGLAAAVDLSLDRLLVALAASALAPEIADAAKSDLDRSLAPPVARTLRASAQIVGARDARRRAVEIADAEIAWQRSIARNRRRSRKASAR